MVARFVLIDHDTPLLFPPNLREWVPADHLVHFILDAVDGLDLGDVGVLVRALRPTRRIDLVSVLALRGGLPLVRPDDLESLAAGLAVRALEPHAETADAGEKFRDAERGRVGHLAVIGGPFLHGVQASGRKSQGESVSAWANC